MNGTAARQARATPAGGANPSGEFALDAWLNGKDHIYSIRASSERRRIGYFRQASYVTIDVIFVCLGAVVAYGVRFGFAHHLGIEVSSARQLIHQAYTHTYPAFLLLYVALIVLACTSQHLYRTPREITALEESYKVAKAVGLATVLLVLFIFVSSNKEISRMVVVSAGVANIGTLAGWRYAKRLYVLKRARRGEGVSRALIIGAGKVGQTLALWLNNNRQLGYSVCDFLDAHPNGDARVLGSIQDLKKVALGQFVDQLFVTLPADREIVKEIWIEARRLRLSLNIIPDIYDGLGWRAPIRSIGGFPIIELHGQPIPQFGLAVKRVLDVVVASVGLILTAPILGLAALWILLDSRGPVIYSALRVGKKGKKFRCYKLRTMVDGADAHKEKLRGENERNGPFFKMENDPRVTWCGRWLRKYSIDELLQFVNVLRGDMSLVGPRPHPIDDYERYTIEHLRRLDVKPGVTGLWQVNARRDPSFDTTMRLDLEYIENWSLRMDLRILMETIPVVLRANGA
ncbi:MAG TPA: sugar transferase [Candidatus Acidoferrum sp.]|nr:sugar transferase [Candidatus Acidoferrum sp.]